MESIGSGGDEKNSRKAVASNVADETIIRNEGRFRHTLRTGSVLENKLGRDAQLTSSEWPEASRCTRCVRVLHQPWTNISDKNRAKIQQEHAYHDYTKAAQKRI